VELKDLTVSDGLMLITDGSSDNKDGSGGWAYIVLDGFDGEASAMGGERNTTNNRMEMMAWIRGLHDIYAAHGSCDIVVVSDSQYVGLGATDPTRKRNVNIDLWLHLDEVMAYHYVEFDWVKGHKGNYWNEAVDKLASEARHAYNYPAE
jgi:ribonuclease HI